MCPKEMHSSVHGIWREKRRVELFLLFHPLSKKKKENVRQTLSQKCDLIKFAPYFDAGERRLFYLSECLLMFADIFFLRSAVVGSVH